MSDKTSISITRPTTNSFPINGIRIWGGEYPFDLDEEKGKQKLQDALDFGITHFIDLTEEGELPPYAHLLNGKAQYMRFPIKDCSAPKSVEEVDHLLHKIDGILVGDENTMVYLHCSGGVGRTGTIAACWIAVTTSYDYTNSLDILNRCWEKCPKSSQRDIPETQEQLDFIKSFTDYNFSFIKQYAEEGDATYQYYLARILIYPLEDKYDEEEAKKWYRKSAEQGFAPAQCALGITCRVKYLCDKKPEDGAEAFKWLTKAANQNHAEAQYWLGECYEYGVGVEVNITEANKHYAKAAEQGHESAIEKINK